MAKDEIVDQVVAKLLPRLDAKFIVDQLKDAPAELKEQLANDIAMVMWSAQRSYALDDSKKFVNTRFLSNGAEVTANGAGMTVGLTGGKGQFDIVNLRGGHAYIDSATNARQINFNVGGGASDCMYNAVVSKCWATEVAAGRGIEGQSLTGSSGCTLQMYSTVQGAFDGIPADSTTRWGILVCAGDYAEDVVLNDLDKVIPDLHGASQHTTLIQSIDLQNFEQAGVKDRSCWSDFTIYGNGTLMFSNSTAQWERLLWERIILGTVGSSAGASGTVTFSNLDNATLRDIRWTGAITSVTISNPEEVRLLDCFVEKSMSWSGVVTRRCLLSGNVFLAASLDFGDFKSCRITNNFWEMSTAHAYMITISGVSADPHGSISGNRFHANSAPTSAFIYLDEWSLTDTNGLGINDNQFGATTYAAGTRVVLSSDTAVRGVNFSNNVIEPDDSGDFIEDLGGFTVSGNFKESTFGPNTSAHKVRYSITGTDNLFIPASSMSGSGSTTVPVITPRYNLYETAGQYDSWLEGAALTPAVGALTLGTDGDMFHVAAGNFASIGTPTRQTLALLIFDGVSVLTHGANLILQGAANFTSAAGDTMLLAWEGGTVWREINRSLTAGAGILGPVQAPVTKTISAGAITLDAGQYVYKIATEGSASSDDLDTINGLEDDRLYIFQNDGTGDTVRLRIAVDNIKAVQQVSYLYLNSQTVWCLGYVEDNSIGVYVTMPTAGLFPGEAGGLEVSGGVLTVPATDRSMLTVDTELSAATDDIDTISGLENGKLYIIRPVDDTHSLVFKHGTGNLKCVGNADITTDDIQDFVFALIDSDDTNVSIFGGDLLTAHVAAADPHPGYLLESLIDAAGDLLYGSADNTPARLAVGTAAYKLHVASGLPAWTKDYVPLVVVFDGGGSVLSTGVQKPNPYLLENLTIEGWTLLADQSGSVVIDIWQQTYASYPPTVANTITASDKPTISTATKGQDLAPTGWDTTLDAGSSLRFNIDSVTSITAVTLTLHCIRR